jgi:hypothetical protein
LNIELELIHKLNKGKRMQIKGIILTILLTVLATGGHLYAPSVEAGWKTKAAAAACAAGKTCRDGAKRAAEKAFEKCKAANCIEKGKTLARSALSKASSFLAKRKALKASIPAKQLQSKFKHAGDFGVKGNYSKATAGRFAKAIKDHIKLKSTETIKGKYRGQDSIIFIDRSSRIGVITKSDGQFISGWKFTAEKVSHLFTKGQI